jgi:hypothetical protein
MWTVRPEVKRVNSVFLGQLRKNIWLEVLRSAVYLSRGATYQIDRMSPDEFLIHQYHLNPGAVLDKLDAQAVAQKGIPRA